MEKQTKDPIQKITEILHKLAILKNQVRTPEQLIAMATYLAKHFSPKEIVEASEYFLQREQFFPGIDRYFAILKPVKTLDQAAIDAATTLELDIKASGNNYVAFLQCADPISRRFIDYSGWTFGTNSTEKERVAIYKILLNKKEFYLGVNNENAQIEQ